MKIDSLFLMRCLEQNMIAHSLNLDDTIWLCRWIDDLTFFKWSRMQLLQLIDSNVRYDWRLNISVDKETDENYSKITSHFELKQIKINFCHKFDLFELILLCNIYIFHGIYFQKFKFKTILFLFLLNLTRETLGISIAFDFYCKLLFAAICACSSAVKSFLMLKSSRICSGLFPLIHPATVLHEICNKPLTSM